MHDFVGVGDDGVDIPADLWHCNMRCKGVAKILSAFTPCGPCRTICL